MLKRDASAELPRGAKVRQGAPFQKASPEAIEMQRRALTARVGR